MAVASFAACRRRGGVPFSRSSCSFRSCSNRVNRFSGGLGASAGFAATAVGIGVGGGAFAFGGSGTSIRNSVPPALCTTGSPSFIATTWQKMFLCWPGGLVLSTVQLERQVPSSPW